MGLAEKQAFRNLNEGDIKQFQDSITAKGLTLKLVVDEASVCDGGLPAIESACNVAREFRQRLTQMAEDPLAQEALNAEIEQVVLHHDGSLSGEYEYTLKKEGKAFVFAANLPIFTMSNTHQKSFKSAMTEML